MDFENTEDFKNGSNNAEKQLNGLLLWTTPPSPGLLGIAVPLHFDSYNKNQLHFCPHIFSPHKTQVK